MKQVSRAELLSFLDIGPAYFQYIAKVLFKKDKEETTLPSAIVKIVGVYRVGFTVRGRNVKQDIIVMENLFYNRKIDQVLEINF